MSINFRHFLFVFKACEICKEKLCGKSGSSTFCPGKNSGVNPKALLSLCCWHLLATKLLWSSNSPEATRMDSLERIRKLGRMAFILGPPVCDTKWMFQNHHFGCFKPHIHHYWMVKPHKWMFKCLLNHPSIIH